MLQNSYREDQEEDLVGIWIRWIDGRRQFLAMPRQFESASAFNPKTGRFEGVSVPSLTELCTRTVFRLAFDPATDTAVSQFLANGRPICSVRERAGGERRPTAFGRSLGATAKTRLPATLLQRLREGPNAYCEADGCGTALFTHAALLLVTPGTRGAKLHLSDRNRFTLNSCLSQEWCLRPPPHKYHSCLAWHLPSTFATRPAPSGGSRAVTTAAWSTPSTGRGPRSFGFTFRVDYTLHHAKRNINRYKMHRFQRIKDHECGWKYISFD